MTEKPLYLYITPFFPSHKSWRGGFCLDAVKAIIRDGRYDVRVFSTSSAQDYQYDGIKVYGFKRLILPSGILPFAVSRINNRLFFRKLNSSGVCVEDIAVCHTHTLSFAAYSSSLKKKNPKIKAINQLHTSFGFDLSSGRLGLIAGHATLLYFYHRRIMESLDFLVFPSKFAQLTFNKYYKSSTENVFDDVRRRLLFGRFFRPVKFPRSVVLYNGIDSRLFFEQAKNAHGEFVIGCIANFFPLKDHRTLISAVSLLTGKIENLKVRLVGSGPTLPEIKKLVSQNNLQKTVYFEKEMGHLEISDFYRQIDLFVLPSLLEGFSCVCAEANSCARSVVFSSCIPFAELLSQEDVRRFQFKAGSPESLAEKILAYHQTRQEQRKVDVDIDRVIPEFLDFLS